jgi:hypothetical protein
LVEFALAIPLVLLLFMGVIELALGFNAFIGLNRASQHAAHLASIAGPQEGADCLILQQIEQDVSAPNNREAIEFVLIQQTSLTGNFARRENRWERNGTTPDCELPNGELISVPYVLADGSDYPESERCSALKGCGDGHSTVDNIAVGIRYRHDWITPLAAIITSLPGGKLGWNFTQRNIFRIEPTL